VVVEALIQAASAPAVPPTSHEPWLSIIGGGLAAAVVTIVFNVWWDSRKQKLTEDWEFKRYHANMIHFAMTGLMEAFFTAKSEMLYLTSTLESLLAALNQLGAQADQIVRQQGGPELTVAVLEQRKQALLEPFKKFNQEQVNLRWGHYEQKAKENHAKAEMHLAALKPLVPAALYDGLSALFQRLSAPFVWDLPGAKEKYRVLENSIPEVLEVRGKLMAQVETKLGRKKG
jgi:hypothetical protein